MTLRVDLHTHTSASDGALPPNALVAEAFAHHLDVVAITDHDTTEGVAPGLEAADAYGLTVVAGVEISTHHPAGELHVLGYGIDTSDGRLEALLARSRGSRMERAKRMVARLVQMGLPIAWRTVEALAGDGTIGRPHIAEALRQAGHVYSIQEAFERYLGASKPAYIPREKIGPCDAIAAIHGARGVAVLAHPIGHLSVVPELAGCGLEGLEAYYTGYNKEAVSAILEAARKHGLFCTGGSDFHGESVIPENILGGVDVPERCYDDLRKALARKACGS
jgi:3',5'-nucleoside bisphosphate phosphatase